MIPNDTKRQKAYAQLRKLTGDRIARALGLADGDLEESLALATHQPAFPDSRRRRLHRQLQCFIRRRT
jgi:hypothetical protein